MDATFRLGIDIGGTFTDAIAVAGEQIQLSKVPSTPGTPGEGVLAAIAALELETRAARPDQFMHGTTLVTNMLLERKGAPTGFITSRGMRDILHLGRHERPLNYAIKQEIVQQHHPPAPRKWRAAVDERLDAQGQVVTPLDEAMVRAAARRLAAEGVQAIAVGFLHAYRYPQHEEQAARWIREEAPDLFICTSSEVSPRFREYERFITAAWNARVAPGAARYLSELAGNLDRRWAGLRLTLMTSNGGLEEIDMTTSHYGDLRRTPIRLALSGPAAAGNAVARVAQDLSIRHCVGLDVGGTSADIVVVRDGRLKEAPWEERRVGGYPLQIPMLDLHTIGAGGGSLAYRDPFGALHVGPESAGASPGPACYGLGGVQPTVTDAAVVAGRLPAHVLLGGSLPIDADRARGSLSEAFGVRGEDLVTTALDVLRLAESHIAFGIRERTVARGLDPAELSLVAAGGAGSLLACGVADVLGLAEVVVPPRPGLLAAWGLLVAPQRREATVTVLRPLQALDSDDAVAFFRRAEQMLPPAPDGAALRRTAALRYMGQGFEVDVDVRDPADIQGMAARFHEAHEHEYGFALRRAPVEWVELRSSWEVAAPDWSFPAPDSGVEDDGQRVPLWELQTGNGKRRPASVQARSLSRRVLQQGDVLSGPAILLEVDATIYIPSGWRGRIVEGGYLRITHEERRA